MDLNGDGHNDIVSMAHDYGIFWMEKGGTATGPSV